jgi:hypothetical protein
VKKHFGTFGGLCVWLGGVLPALVAGCVPPPAAFGARSAPDAVLKPLPDWAIHIKALRSVTAQSTPAQIEALRRELLEPELQAGKPYSPPEQIAAMAVAELNAHHDWDAALLLVIATFRYRQQAELAVKVGDQDRQLGRIDTRRTDRAQQLERRLLWRPNFFREVQLVRLRLHEQGIAASDASLTEAGTTVGDLESGHSRVPTLESSTDPTPTLGSRPEDLQYPELAATFLARLQVDRARGTGSLLEKVPLTSFRREALHHSTDYLAPWLIPDVLAQADALRQSGMST